ncbi:glycosyltransferase family 2 protein [Candidatus Nomurabacteria bacterium]|nr:glycosyltransferase family 2 protein [Candidatus Nomurabacteria bacterium]
MTKKQRDYYLYRGLEIIPGFLVWATFIFAITVSIINPLLGIYVIIAFDVYWILRIAYLSIFLLISWFKYRKTIKTDWWNFLQHNQLKWQEYYHLIFLPTAGEPFEVVDRTFSNLAKSKYDHKKMIIILGGEEGLKDHFEPIRRKIEEKYSSVFYKILVTLHPKDLPGELRGKGANLYHMGRQIKKYVDQNDFDYKKLIVSAFDVDTITHPEYFAYLTHKFLSHKNPYQTSFQPMAFYHNNVWGSDPFTKVVANSTTFWLLTDLARPDRLFTFSSHSMSWQALVDVGFWQNNIVTEDSRIFLQCFIKYDGNYQTEPMHIPVSMNSPYIGPFWKSMVNQYKQMRRWAWGVEHFPYMVWRFSKKKKIPLKKKIIYIWNQTEGVYSWATAPIIILIMGQLPLYVAELKGTTNALTQNAPLVLQTLMTSGMFGLLIIAIMSIVILPPMPDKKEYKKFKLARYTLVLLQWVVFPLTMIIFGSIPAVDAQTRLMLGKYMGFNVTKKN